VTVTPVNDAPVVTSGGPASVYEGSSVSASVSFTDVEPSDTHTCSIAWGDTGTSSGTVTESNGVGTCTGTHIYADDNPPVTSADDYTATFTITDNASIAGGGPTATGSATDTITVRNANPIVTITSPAGGAIFPLGPSGVTVTFNGAFTDAGVPDLHTVCPAGGPFVNCTYWTIDSVKVPGSVNETAHTATATYTFTATGVYLITLTVYDDDRGFGSANTVNGSTAMIVIYDPNGGFVTGGGYVQSPVNAAPAYPTMVGKANYGFVAKYQKNQTLPQGETEFQFKPANINFHSSSLDWLVVTVLSPTTMKAQYQGSGTNNGVGNYKFLVTVIDGGSTDYFRIKIWDSTGVLYDNMGAGTPGNPTAAPESTNPTGAGALGAGGNIVVHDK
jgi:hypothetical protein